MKLEGFSCLLKDLYQRQEPSLYVGSWSELLLIKLAGDCGFLSKYEDKCVNSIHSSIKLT